MFFPGYATPPISPAYSTTPVEDEYQSESDSSSCSTVSSADGAATAIGGDHGRAEEGPYVQGDIVSVSHIAEWHYKMA